MDSQAKGLGPSSASVQLRIMWLTLRSPLSISHPLLCGHHDTLLTPMGNSN